MKGPAARVAIFITNLPLKQQKRLGNWGHVLVGPPRSGPRVTRDGVSLLRPSAPCRSSCRWAEPLLGFASFSLDLRVLDAAPGP